MYTEVKEIYNLDDSATSGGGGGAIPIYEEIIPVYDQPPAPIEPTKDESNYPEQPPAGMESTTIALTIFSGTVIDYATGKALPGATVCLYNNGGKIQCMAADFAGEFYFSPEVLPTHIEITRVGYKTYKADAGIYNNTNYFLAPMQIGDPLEEVIVTDNREKSSDIWFYIAMSALYLNEQRKKQSVGKIDTGTLFTVGIGAAMFLGFDTLKKLFESLGFWKSEEDKNIEAEKNNPYSPWSPAFLESAPSGSWLITYATAQQMMENIVAGFGWFNDDEARVIGVFKSLKTQSQLASFAYHFYNMYATDLLSWLTGDDEPGADRLSNEEVNQINEFIHKLPKYIP